MMLNEIYMFASKKMECKSHVKLIIKKKKSRKENRNLDSHKTTPDKPTKRYAPYSCHRNDNTIQPLKSSQLENNSGKTYIKFT